MRGGIGQASQDLDRRIAKIFERLAVTDPYWERRLTQLRQDVITLVHSSRSSQIEQEDYNIAAVRALLLKSFTPEELWRFCQDRPLIHPVCQRFNLSSSLEDAVGATITYCMTNALLGELLDEISATRPRQYERFRAGLEKSATGILVTRHMQDLPSELAFQIKEEVRVTYKDAYWSGEFDLCRTLCDFALLLDPHDPEALRYRHDAETALSLRRGY